MHLGGWSDTLSVLGCIMQSLKCMGVHVRVFKMFYGHGAGFECTGMYGRTCQVYCGACC